MIYAHSEADCVTGVIDRRAITGRLRNGVEQGGTDRVWNNHDARHPRLATPSASRLCHLRQ